MKKIISSILITIMILMSLPIAVMGQEVGGVSQYLDKTLSHMINQKQVKGVIVSVVRNGTNELVKGYGFADEEKGIAAHEDSTAFRIGSISKTFVAIAAQQLVQSGKLDMDAPISIYLEDDFPKFKYDITMQDLLTYTAGFEDMFSGIAVKDISKAEPLSLSIRKYIPDQVFVPGEVVSYSNYSIALAAYVVQRITGEDFYVYADKNIFEPLGMTKTSFKLDYEGVKVSKAYGTNGKETPELLMNLYPEGSVVSTATDMSKYIKWLLGENNKVLNVEAKSLFDQQYTMTDEFEGVGYTWSRQERGGVLYYIKKGETPNFYSRIAIYPEQKTGVFISFNTYVKEEALDAIMSEVTRLILGNERQPSLYTGRQTEDISGCYISTRSNFQNQEKVTNFLTPNRVFKIKGCIAEGFSIKGNKLLPIGENYYSTPMGNLKYVDRNGDVYLANKTPTSFVRTDWYESNGIQMLVFIIFTVLSLIMAAIGIVRLLRRKPGNMNYYISILAVIHIALFIGMCILIFSGISSLNMLDVEALITMCGVLIAITSFSGIIYTVHLYTKKLFTVSNILIIAWNISNILFCLWMFQVNIL